MKILFIVVNTLFQVVCIYHIGWLRARMRFSKVVVKPVFAEWDVQLKAIEASGKDIDWQKLFYLFMNGHLSKETDPWLLRKVEAWRNKDGTK